MLPEPVVTNAVSVTTPLKFSEIEPVLPVAALLSVTVVVPIAVTTVFAGIKAEPVTVWLSAIPAIDDKPVTVVELLRVPIAVTGATTGTKALKLRVTAPVPVTVLFKVTVPEPIDVTTVPAGIVADPAVIVTVWRAVIPAVDDSPEMVIVPAAVPRTPVTADTAGETRVPPGIPVAATVWLVTIPPIVDRAVTNGEPTMSAVAVTVTSGTIEVTHVPAGIPDPETPSVTSTPVVPDKFVTNEVPAVTAPVHPVTVAVVVVTWTPVNTRFAL
jgi:hypothetical protein